MGEDDKCSPWENIQFMKDNFPPEKTDNFEVVSYPKAGHLIEPPYTPLCSMSYHKTFGMYIFSGMEHSFYLLAHLSLRLEVQLLVSAGLSHKSLSVVSVHIFKHLLRNYWAN